MKKFSFFKYLPRYLPGRNIAFLLVVVVLGAGAFLSLGNWIGGGKIKGENKQSKSDNLIIAQDGRWVKNNEADVESNKDTDGDGLKDWEEKLWGTDFQKADTDGDGFSDKEEIDGGYDPLDQNSNSKTGVKAEKKAGEGMSFYTDAGIPNPDVALDATMPNFTEAMATMFGKYMQENGGAQGQTNTVGQLSFDDIASNPKIADMVAIYTATFDVKIPDSDLIISSDNSYPAVKEYSKKLLDIIGKEVMLPKLDESFMASIQKGDFSAADRYIKYFDGMANDVKKIAVPEKFVATHKAQIEIFLSFERVFMSLKKMNEDAVKAMIGIGQYEKIKEKNDAMVKDFIKVASEYI